jgi:hypothetical protein
LDQLSPESAGGGSGLDGAPEDAQAAEITSDERARTRAPSDFFMTDPPRNRTSDDPWFDEEYTAAAVRIEARQFLQELFRFAPGSRSNNTHL